MQQKLDQRKLRRLLAVLGKSHLADDDFLQCLVGRLAVIRSQGPDHRFQRIGF